jgi:hypothetical protein
MLKVHYRNPSTFKSVEVKAVQNGFLITRIDDDRQTHAVAAKIEEAMKLATELSTLNEQPQAQQTNTVAAGTWNQRAFGIAQQISNCRLETA